MTDAPNLSDSELIARVEGGVGRLTLNRPRALHALTTDMCRAMAQALLAWREDPKVQLVLIDHAGERGFCAGGDIRRAAQSGAGDGLEAREFFLIEYRLNHLLHTYPKPTVAIGDGLVMGGGAGLFMPCRYRVATERTLFAMPETAIGLFPDVGAAWYLPRLAGSAGLWLAMTGARLKAADCLWLGLATHHVNSAGVDALKAAILAAPLEVEAILDVLPPLAEAPPLAQAKDLINSAFNAESAEEILSNLAASPEPWAADQREILGRMSPQSLKVAVRHLADGARASRFAEVMTQDYALAVRIVPSHDFIEGVRAVIIDKDGAPRWDPPGLAGVTQARLDALFAPLPAGEAWTPLP